MRIGFSLPQHGSAATAEGLSTIARWAEAIGYESLWVWERLLAPADPKTPYPLGDGAHPNAFRAVLDPIAALTFAAAQTERVALGTSVLVLPLYNPIVLARQLTAIDVLSKGRLRVGLGVGWNEDEIEASGVPFAERGRRADEALQLMKAIWTRDPVEFRGKFFRLPPSYIQKPVQKPHPPIYMGAYTPASMRRLALEADGWNVVGVPLTAVSGKFQEIRRIAAEAGRDPTAIELVVRANVVPAPKPLGADRADFHGTLEQIGEDVRRAREVGASELFFDLWTAHPEVDSLDDWLSWMQKLYAIARSQ